MSFKHKEITIPTLLGLFVAILGLGSGLFLLRGQIRLNSQASADEVPSEVRITNVSDNSFVVSWFTQKALSGYVQYGESGRDTDLVVSDERDQQKGEVGNYFTHFVSIRGLRPETGYEFRVGSGRSVFDNNGQAYTITTAPQLPNQPTADVAYGMVVTQNSDPADGAIVYLAIDGMSPQAGLVKGSGSWVVPLATARSIDLRSFATYNKDSSPITITVQGATMGTSRINSNTGNDSPVPQITLGESTALIQPITTNSVSKIGDNSSLKILTPNVGTPINNSNIEVTGQAAPGAVVDIEIHSDVVISGQVVTGTDGTFRYTIPSDLTPGEHTVTISSLINGVVQKVTRSFTVYAADESGLPFYTSTPSATLIPTPFPTLTLSPSPTLPPRVTNPATESALPVSGNEWMTWLLLGAGVILLTSGVVWYKKSVN